jgi:3-phenylpropionate/trans-cinnamate dioxygenase ferredoxin component
MKRRLCSLADLPEGGARVFDVDGVSLAAARSASKVFVVENRCSHDDGPLGEGRVFGSDIECPRHGARFDLATGRATRMPAVAPIETFEATIQGADVFVEMPDL